MFSLTNLCDASSRWDWNFIFIFRNFEARTPANITGLGFATNWPLTRVPQQNSCFKSERNELFGSRGSRASDKIAISLSAASQILNKAKDFFESLKYYLRMQPTNLGRRCGPEGNLVASMWQFNCLFKKEQMMLARAHNRNTVPLRGPLRAWGGLCLSLVWISKPVVSRIDGEAISLSVFYYWFFAFLSRCRSFNPSLCRLSPFLLHCRCSKAMSLVGIYPNGAPALTGSSLGTKETDRVINTSNHFIVSIKLYVDLDVGNVEDIGSFFVILAAASWTVF